MAVNGSEDGGHGMLHTGDSVYKERNFAANSESERIGWPEAPRDIGWRLEGARCIWAWLRDAVSYCILQSEGGSTLPKLMATMQSRRDHTVPR